ncbi:CARDB domain-containing protein [Chloroflexota bacterium]
MKHCGWILWTVVLMMVVLSGCVTAEYRVTPPDIPKQVIVDEPFTVMVEVTNIGRAEGQFVAELTLDGTVVETSEMIIATGQTKTISLTHEIDDSGTYELSLNGYSSEVIAMTPAELASNAYNNSIEASAIQGDMILDMDMKTSESGEEYDVALYTETEYIFDNENKEMEMVTGVIGVASDWEGIEGTVDIYIIDDTLYTREDISDGISEWQREDVPTDYWENIQLIQQQAKIGESAEVDYLGMEKVKDVNCFVLQIKPDQDVVADVVFSQLAQITGEEADEMLEFTAELVLMLMDISMKQWVSEDELFIKRAELDMDIDLSAFGFLMGISLDLNVESYNEPVSIRLPISAN